MIVNEQVESNGDKYLLIQSNGTKYRTNSFSSLASLYTNMPQPIYHLETNKKFAMLDLSNVGTFMIHAV